MSWVVLVVCPNLEIRFVSSSAVVTSLVVTSSRAPQAGQAHSAVSTQRVVDTPLVWSNQFIDNSVMDTSQSACQQRPQEPMVEVVAPSSPATAISPVTKYWQRGCAPTVAAS